jgi:hypothetical protein
MSRALLSPCGVEKELSSAALRVADEFRLYKKRRRDTVVVVGA